MRALQRYDAETLKNFYYLWKKCGTPTRRTVTPQSDPNRMQSCIRFAPGCFGSPAPVCFSALFPEVPHLPPAKWERRCGFDWSGNQQSGGPASLKKKGRRSPYAAKKRGRRYSRHNKVLRTLHGSFPYAQAGRPPEGRDTTQVSDKFYTVNKIVSLRQSQVLLWYKGLS